MKNNLRALFRGRAAPAAAPASPELEAPVEAPAAVPAQVDLAETLSMFERDVTRIVGGLAAEILSAREKSRLAVEHLGGVKDAIRTLVETSSMIDTEISGIASSADELTASADAIASTVSQVQDRSSATLSTAAASEAAMEGLGAAVSEIGGLLNAIAEVASRTNLLALNATIEAARAGEAGRGFAVVAGEVKALSVTTARTVSVIREKMEALQRASDDSIGNMRRIRGEIGALTPICDEIAQSVETQRATIGELAHRMQVAQGAVSEVAANVKTVNGMAEDAGAVSAEAEEVSAHAASEAGELARRMNTVLRTIPAADRRRAIRYPIDLAMRVRAGGETIACHTFDISEGGLLIRSAPGIREKLSIGGRFEAEIARVGTVRLHVLQHSDLGVHCAFETLDSAIRAALLATIEGFRVANLPLIERAQGFAAEIARAIEAEIAAGRLDEAQVFDEDYRPVPETDPVQLTTRYLQRFEAIIPPIIARTLPLDPKMAFCVAVDRNGYIPVHVPKVSQPQRKGDRAWNHANCRNRRIFDDRAGLLAARLTTPFLIQSYYRDLGGTRVAMKEIDAPITIRGRHWGGVRMAYSI
ncbi:MAG: methyl-accepting chemotaxis protein [Hyphomicrobiales bacterium]|nr:methyl-accepting chemotaxis protein [Hyphomicrobiales bacterium]